MTATEVHESAIDVLPGSFPAGIREDLERQRQARMATIDQYDVGQPERAMIEHDLGEIEAALARIEAGTFGSCTACGTAIPPERLEAMPSAELCITCQHDQETRAF